MAAVRIVAVIGALVGAGLVLAACGGSGGGEADGSQPAPAADRKAAAAQMLSDALARRPAVVVPGGFRVRHESASGLSIAFPRRWFALRGSDARWPGIIQMFDRYSDQLAPAIRALAIPESPLVMLAFDPRKRHGFATNANVMVAAAKPGATFRSWSSAVRREVRALPSVKGAVAAEHVVLPAGEALRLEFVRVYPRTHGEDLRLATTQYAVTRGDRTYLLVFSTLPRLTERYEDVFAAAAKTLSLVD